MRTGQMPLTLDVMSYMRQDTNGDLFQREKEPVSSILLTKVIVRVNPNGPTLALPARAEARNPGRIAVLPFSRLFSAGQARQIADQLCGH
jgi:hypothetical protein